MTISFINQEIEEITKTGWRIDSCEIKEDLWQAKFPSCVVLLLRLDQ